MKKVVLLASVAVIVLACGLAEAMLVNLNCTKDTYVQDGTYVNTNYGSATQLYVGMGTAANQKRYAYMAFSTVPLIGVNVNDIQTAKLKLNWVGSVPATKNGTIDRPRFAWDESTLTWNTQGTDFATVVNWSDDFATTAGYDIEVDITDLVKGWKAGTIVNNGIRFRNFSGGYSVMLLDSREEATRGMPPIVEVTYVPEPATMALLGLGALVFARRK